VFKIARPVVCRPFQTLVRQTVIRAFWPIIVDGRMKRSVALSRWQLS